VTSEVVQKVEVNIGAYCPSKAALYSITKVLAKEWGKFKIRVNSLAPCFVNTVLNEPLFAQKKEFYEPKLKGVPIGRHSEPEDLIGAAVFLASDASNYVTGTTADILPKFIWSLVITHIAVWISQLFRGMENK
jgi:NAD(P)-dependent dehydrogenase (short-subunit alcohol dehydrogenase family)